MSNKDIKGSVVASSGTKQDDYWVGSLEKVLLGESWGSTPHPFVSIRLTTTSCGMTMASTRNSRGFLKHYHNMLFLLGLGVMKKRLKIVPISLDKPLISSYIIGRD